MDVPVILWNIYGKKEARGDCNRLVTVIGGKETKDCHKSNIVNKEKVIILAVLGQVFLLEDNDKIDDVLKKSVHLLTGFY